MKKYILVIVILLLAGFTYFIGINNTKIKLSDHRKEKFELIRDDKLIDLKEFFLKNEHLIYTYTVENNGTVSKVTYTPNKDVKTFELKIDKISAKNIANEKISQVSIPILEQGALKINKDFYDKYKMHTCEISSYSNNTYYYDALRAGVDIFCKTEDQKTILNISLVENIGVTFFNVVQLKEDQLKILYGSSLFSISDENNTVEGEELTTPNFINIEWEEK